MKILRLDFVSFLIVFMSTRSSLVPTKEACQHYCAFLYMSWSQSLNLLMNLQLWNGLTWQWTHPNRVLSVELSINAGLRGVPRCATGLIARSKRERRIFDSMTEQVQVRKQIINWECKSKTTDKTSTKHCCDITYWPRIAVQIFLLRRCVWKQ